MSYDVITPELEDAARNGKRPLDIKTREKIDNFSESNYDLIVRGIEFPYTEQNFPGAPEHVTYGVHELGETPLALFDVDQTQIELIDSAAKYYIDEREEKLEKFQSAVKNVNEFEETDWNVTATLYVEEPFYHAPETSDLEGVHYTEESLERIRESEEFADLSRSFYGGWLEISPQELLTRKMG